MYSQISGDLDFDLGKESNISSKNKKGHVENCQKEKWLGKVLGPVEYKVKSYHWSKNKEEQTMQVQKNKRMELHDGKIQTRAAYSRRQNV